MPLSTNVLVVNLKGNARRFAAPVVLGAAIVGGATLFLNHNGVHAASFVTSPMDDNSVSSLVALDNAVESVAARVTPAVVNIAVTSKQTASADDDGDGQQQAPQRRGQQGLPPGLSSSSDRAAHLGSTSRGRSSRRSSMESAQGLLSRPTDIS